MELLCLASCTHRNVFEVYPCCGICQYFIPLCDWITIQCMAIPHLVYPFTCWWLLVCFYFLALMTSGAVNIGVQVFVCTHIFNPPEEWNRWHVCGCAQSRLTLCDPVDCSPPVSSVHGILQARTGVVCHFLLQGIFPTQGSNPRLLCWQSDSLPLSCQGSLLIYVNCSFNFYQEKRSRIYFKSDLKWQMNKHTSFII